MTLDWIRAVGVACCAAALLLAVPTVAQPLRLNDTGQITCYDASAPTGTVSPTTPNPTTAGFSGQDCVRGAAAADALGRMVKVGGSAVPGRDYTKIANNGSVLPATATLGSGPTDWGCTRDNITGLIWEIKTTAGLRSMNHSYTWYDTNPAINGGNAGEMSGDAELYGGGCGGTLSNCNTSAYRDAINALTGGDRLCGATDWRLPTTMELEGLIDFGVTGLAIDTTWFPNTGFNPGSHALLGEHWTGDTSTAAADAANLVNFYGGVTIASFKRQFHFVRLVRGR